MKILLYFLLGFLFTVSVNNSFAQKSIPYSGYGISLGITPVYYSFSDNYSYFRSDLTFDFRASKKNGILIGMQYVKVAINDLIFRDSMYGLYAGYRRDLYHVNSESRFSDNRLLLVALLGFELREDGGHEYEQSSIGYDIGLRWYFKKIPYVGMGFHMKYIDSIFLIERVADIYVTVGIKL